METTTHNNRKHSDAQNVHNLNCFAPGKQTRGVYFGVESILCTILQIDRLWGLNRPPEKGKSPPIKRKMEGFCKEKEKLFARLRGSPPWKHNTTEQKLRETQPEFAGFVVLWEAKEVLYEN